jgi:hypothetical protein
VKEDMRLAVQVDDMAEACIANPGLVTTAVFDEFVDGLRAVSEDVARAFVQRVYAGLAAGADEKEARDG